MEPIKKTANPFPQTFITMNIKINKHQYAKVPTESHAKIIK